MSGTVEVSLTVRIEHDPAVFPVESSGVTVYAGVDGRPVIGVRDVNVDPATLGEAAIGLLYGRMLGQRRDEQEAP